MIRVGTRGSALALAQSKDVLKRLRRRWPSVKFRLVVVKTMGDEFQSVELFKKTNVGVFTKAIEEKLLSGEIDAAVHSLKDLPTDSPAGLELAAVPRRLDARDVLISRRRWTLASLPPDSVVGTGSPRRMAQLAALRPDLVIESMRGNLDTRVRKVLSGDYDAVVVAEAGLRRLGRYLRYASPIRPDALLPAVGQAALGIQVRRGDARALKIMRALNHPATEREVAAERALLKALRGGCRVPLGVHSKIRGKTLALKAAVFSVRGRGEIAAEIRGPVSGAESLGRRLASKLLRKGAAAFMKEARE